MQQIYGYMLISLGIGIIITLIIPEEFWTFIIASICIVIGITIIRC